MREREEAAARAAAAGQEGALGVDSVVRHGFGSERTAIDLFFLLVIARLAAPRAMSGPAFDALADPVRRRILADIRRAAEAADDAAADSGEASSAD